MEATERGQQASDEARHRSSLIEAGTPSDEEESQMDGREFYPKLGVGLEEEADRKSQEGTSRARREHSSPNETEGE